MHEPSGFCTACSGHSLMAQLGPDAPAAVHSQAPVVGLQLPLPLQVTAASQYTEHSDPKKLGSHWVHWLAEVQVTQVAKQGWQEPSLGSS